MEFYTPQRNKAEKKVAYYKWSIENLEGEERKKELSRRMKGRLEYHRRMLDVWQLDLEQLNFKISKVQRA